MAREIVVGRDGATSRFGIERVSREKLYGKRTRVVVDDAGSPCQPGTLLRDGSALLLPGAIAQVYVDGAFDVVERDALQAVDADGRLVEKVPSTLGVEQPLVGPVPPERLLDTATTAVYALEAAEVDPALAEALAAGAIYETRFSYRGGYEDSPVFLLQNEHGLFALVAEEAPFGWLEREVPAADEEDDPFDDDELDFSMF
ncbi:MAG: hypothetical protein EP329_11605 [Deltaproteobacteria bacterium]|nr:MAG: hypothetical protein EP329_11605 [Deltaproteobacteria bacterium]